MPVFGEQGYPEEIRLKYRFLDLRREQLHNNIMLRGRVIDSIRRRMKEAGFFEFQTPILTASSPEGARDYLVPSRLHPGKFYALPQAPQQFKQLIMVAGFDRYFQIAPCFRDEDARADRSPGEFYQLDLEMSFVTQQDVFDAVEPVIRGVFEEFANGKPVTPKFPLIPYADALRKYGSDKPDLRNPIVMQDVSEAFRGSGFKIFSKILETSGNAVWAIPAPKGGNRAFCDRMNSWAQGEGQPGLGYNSWREGEEGGAGPLAKNIGPERTKQIADQMKLGVGDACFFVAGKPKDFVCNGVELSLGRDRGNHRPGGHEEGLRDRRLRRAGPAREQVRWHAARAVARRAAPRRHRARYRSHRHAACGRRKLREVVLFPMNQRAEDLMMGAPSEATPKQLKELHIRLELPKK